jgi:hypothetical protein
MGRSRFTAPPSRGDDMTQQELDAANVQAMQALARTIGLTALLVKACKSNNRGATTELLRQALRLLGETP